MSKKNNIITYNDPLIFRKKKQIDETVVLTDEGFPMPSVVEISGSGMCPKMYFLSIGAELETMDAPTSR